MALCEPTVNNLANMEKNVMTKKSEILARVGNLNRDLGRLAATLSSTVQNLRKLALRVDKHESDLGLQREKTRDLEKRLDILDLSTRHPVHVHPGVEPTIKVGPVFRLETQAGAGRPPSGGGSGVRETDGASFVRSASKWASAPTLSENITQALERESLRLARTVIGSIFVGGDEQVVQVATPRRRFSEAELAAMREAENVPCAGEMWVHRHSQVFYKIVEVVHSSEDASLHVVYRDKTIFNSTRWTRPIDNFRAKFVRI